MELDHTSLTSSPFPDHLNPWRHRWEIQTIICINTTEWLYLQSQYKYKHDRHACKIGEAHTVGWESERRNSNAEAMQLRHCGSHPDSRILIKSTPLRDLIKRVWHYIDVIMTTMAFQITSLMVVYSTVYSDADQNKHQSSASLASVWGIHRARWIPRTKGQLRGKCFRLMTSSWDTGKYTGGKQLHAVQEGPRCHKSFKY